MIQDLHSHTYYSFCGKDRPESVVEAAIAGGIRLFGISDHNYGIGYGRIDCFNSQSPDILQDYGRCLMRYFDHINLIKEKYADKITVLRGIELNTIRDRNHPLPDNADVSYFDYCLLETLDWVENSVTNGDAIGYAKRVKCPMGIAHTDLFAHAERMGYTPYDYFSRLAEAGIFWEMNVSYDSIHGYRQHRYMLDFFDSPEQQEIVKKSGIKLSIGFDGHKVEDYLPERVADYCKRVEDMGIPLQFSELFEKE